NRSVINRAQRRNTVHVANLACATARQSIKYQGDCKHGLRRTLTERHFSPTCFFRLCGLNSSTRVTCRIASSLSGPTESGPLMPGLPTKTRPPYTQANYGCGTAWLEPSERHNLKGRKGFRSRSSLMRLGEII